MNEVILCNVHTVMEQSFCLNHLDVLVSLHSYVTSTCLKSLPNILYLHVYLCAYGSCIAECLVCIMLRAITAYASAQV